MSFAAERSPLKGIGLKVMAVTVFIAMAACIKAAQGDPVGGDGLPPGQAVWGRSFFALPVVIVWLWLRHDLRDGLKTVNPWGHVWRGLIGTAAMLTGFGALGLLPLPQVTAIFYAIPVFTVILAVIFLHERIRVFRLSAVLVGIAGVLIVAWPDLAMPDAIASDGTLAAVRAVGAVLALTSAFLGGVAQVLIRRLVETEETAAIVFYFQLSATVFGLATLPLAWVWETGFLQPWLMPSPLQWLLLAAAGVLGGVGQILHTSAYRYADASVIAPFEYASIVLAIAIGYVVFSEVPSENTLLGVTVVIAAGIFIIWREARLGMERNRSKRIKTING